MEILASKCDYPNAFTMIHAKLPSLWKYEEPEKWDTSSPPWRILSFIAGELKAINGFVFDLLLRTIETTPQAEIKLKSFNMLTGAMETLECEPYQLQLVLLTNLKWKAGRTASVLRSSVALCALTALKTGRLQMDKENANVWADVLHYLIEDELTNTRLTVLKILKICLTSGMFDNRDKILPSNRS